MQHEQGKELPDADLASIQESIRISNAAIQGNFTGPYTAAVTFVSFPLCMHARLSVASGYFQDSSDVKDIPLALNSPYFLPRGACTSTHPCTLWWN